MKNKTRMYKVGYYNKKGERVLQDNLKPMTHKDACTFRSKMMDVNNFFLYEVHVNENNNAVLGVSKRLYDEHSTHA